jgi:hypothetical protein
VKDSEFPLAFITLWGDKMKAAWVSCAPAPAPSQLKPFGFPFPWQPGDLVLVSGLRGSVYRQQWQLTCVGDVHALVLARGGVLWKKDSLLDLAEELRTQANEQMRLLHFYSPLSRLVDALKSGTALQALLEETINMALKPDVAAAAAAAAGGGGGGGGGSAPGSLLPSHYTGTQQALPAPEAPRLTLELEDVALPADSDLRAVPARPEGDRWALARVRALLLEPPDGVRRFVGGDGARRFLGDEVVESLDDNDVAAAVAGAMECENCSGRANAREWLQGGPTTFPSLSHTQARVWCCGDGTCPGGTVRRAFSPAWAALDLLEEGGQQGEEEATWARVPPQVLGRLLAGIEPENLWMKTTAAGGIEEEGQRQRARADAAALLRALTRGSEPLRCLLRAVPLF